MERQGQGEEEREGRLMGNHISKKENSKVFFSLSLAILSVALEDLDFCWLRRVQRSFMFSLVSFPIILARPILPCFWLVADWPADNTHTNALMLYTLRRTKDARVSEIR